MRAARPHHDIRASRRGGPPLRIAVASLIGLGLLGGGAGQAWATEQQLEPAPIPGPATTTLPGTLLEGGYTDGGVTTVFVYASVGDEVVARLATSSRTPAGSRVVVTDPTGAVVHDDAAPAAIAGTFLGGAWTATVDGVWAIDVVDVPGAAGASFAWDVAAVRDGASIPGRVWTDSLAIYTPDETRLDIHAAAPDGGLYRVTLDGYDGVDSTLRMNDVGNALAGSCEPAHASVPMRHSPEADGWGAGYWQPTARDCADLSDFRLFLDAPAADLPQADDAWADGRTTDTWLSATYASPTIADLAFARTAPSSNAGTLSGQLLEQPGVLQVEVDADGDGAFDGATDVVAEVTVLEPGPFTWRWDGVDAAGQAVPPTTTGVAIRASTAQVAPLHFLRIDSETSTGGIAVEAITGPAPGIAPLHWDDGLLAPSSHGRWSQPSALESSGDASLGGVHGWEAGGAAPNQNDGVAGSWGDLRSIDDWAFITDRAEATVALEALPDLRIDKRVEVEAVLAADGSSAIVQWTLEVANLGQAAAPEVLVTDAYPAELDVASVVLVAAPSQGAFDEATGAWRVGALDAGARASVTFQGTVATTPGAAATIVNAARVSNPQVPPSTGDCVPNDDLASDDDRCDVVETPLVPTPTPTPTPEPEARPTPTPAAVEPPAAGPTHLPQTGAGVDPVLAAVGAGVAASGVLVLVLRRRLARRARRAG